MTVTQTTDPLAEQCCELLMSYPDLRSVRIVLSGGVGYDRALGAVQIARAHRLRCWVSKQEIVFRVPDNAQPLRIDRRGGGRIVPLPPMEKKESQ